VVLVGVGALVLVLVLLVGALAATRQTDDQSSVGTDDGSMPLLGWNEGTYEVPSFRGGGDYTGTWRPPGSEGGDQGVLLSVNPEGLYPDPEGDVSTITVGGRMGRLIHLPEHRETTAPEYIVSWEPRPAWTAMLAVVHSPDVTRPLDSAGNLDLLTRAAKAIRPIGPEAFGAAVDRGTQGRTAPAALVFAVDEGRSVARWVNSSFVIIALAPVPGGAQTTELCIGIGKAQRHLEGSAVTVRGTEATVVDVPVPSSPPATGLPPDIGPNGLRTIAWSEGDAFYRLAVDGSVSIEDAVAMADAMHTPTAEEWSQLFVVVDPPRGGSDIYC